MVFLIQNTQNRDTLALQVKLSELILSLQNADDKLAFVEDTAETDLEEIHDELRSRVQSSPDS
jgi:low affinity Fe/Cu permease